MPLSRFLFPLLLLCSFIANGQSYGTMVLSIADPRPALLIPGDAVLINVELSNKGAKPTKTLTISLTLPPGLVALEDSLWQVEEQTAKHRHTNLLAQQRDTLTLYAQIAPDFTGDVLKISASIEGQKSSPATLTLPVAELIKTEVDTCLRLRDSTQYEINNFVGITRRVTARPRGPYDLSPTLPVRISSGKCPVLKLDGKKRQRKDRCSCFHLILSPSNQPERSARYKPNGKALKGYITVKTTGSTGDTVLISVKTIDKAPLRDLLLMTEDSTVLAAAQSANTLEYLGVLTSDTAELRLYLRAKRSWLFFTPKRFATVTIVHKPKTMTVERATVNFPTPTRVDTLARVITEKLDSVEIWQRTEALRSATGTVVLRIRDTLDFDGKTVGIPDTVGRDTCAGAIVIQRGDQLLPRTDWVPTDTILAQIADETATIVGSRNPMGKSYINLPISVPLSLDIADSPAKDSLVALAYWVGIGEPSLLEYDALAEEVPPEWSQPGVSPPLAAFGFGHPIVLPDLGVDEKTFRKEYVRYDFQNLRRQTVISRNPKRANYGIVTGANLAVLLNRLVYNDQLKKDVPRLQLVLNNQHVVNTYRVRVIVVGFYQVTEPATKWGK